MNIIYSFKKLITYRKSTSVLPSTWTMKLQCNGETENVLSWGTLRKKAICLDTQIMSEHRLANRKKNREEQLILLSPESDRWIESASSVLVLSISCINRVSFPLKARLKVLQYSKFDKETETKYKLYWAIFICFCCRLDWSGWSNHFCRVVKSWCTSVVWTWWEESVLFWEEYIDATGRMKRPWSQEG